MAKVPKRLFLLLLPVISLSSCWFSKEEEPWEAPAFNPAEAALKLQESPMMEPGGVEKRVSLGNRDYLRGRPKSAIREYERALELNPNKVEAWYNLGIAYSNEGMTEDALRAWEKVLEL
ncbi:MAG: tetratricopeptide repeat protein, partial [Candidatus Brocadiales bacterium]